MYEIGILPTVVGPEVFIDDRILRQVVIDRIGLRRHCGSIRFKADWTPDNEINESRRYNPYSKSCSWEELVRL
jgi:hypothetical protein